MDTSIAPGHPGTEPHWTSSAKDGLGTATSADSRVWFSLSHSILNEIYHPYIDHVATRDFGLLVADGRRFFSEEKCDTHSEIHLLAPGVPGYRLTNACTQGGYRLTKTIITDPQRDVLLQHLHV
jgi:glucoamylase